MKLKFSKTGLLILAAGVFIVALAGLGMTRSGQLKQQDKLATDLASSQLRLNKVDTSPLLIQLDELQQQLADSQEQLGEVKAKLVQKIQSVDVTDKLFEIASYYSVNVTVMGTTAIAHQNYQGIPCSVISVDAQATGILSDIMNFISGLNNNYSTGYVTNTRLDIANDVVNEPSQANVTFIVYSYEGN